MEISKKINDPFPLEGGVVGEYKHLLVIRLSAMGDVAMTVPVLLALTKQHPRLKITVLTRAFFRPMFSQVPNVAIFEADVKGKHKGVFGLYKMYKELKKLNFTAVADLHNVVRSNVLKCFFKIGGVSFIQIDKGRAEKKALIDINNKVLKSLKTTHQRYANVFNDLGFSIDINNTQLLPKGPLSDKMLQTIGFDSRRWIGIAPFAAFKGKMYPLELIKEIIKELNTTEKYKIILFGGGKQEQEQLEALAEQFDHAINVAGKFSFEQELSLVSNLDAMVAMDSGNAHLAAMYAIPTITLWGVTHPNAGFAPYKQKVNVLLADRIKYPLIPTSIYGNKFPAGYEKAIETITPSMVINKIKEVLV